MQKVKQFFLFISAKLLWVQTIIILSIVYFFILGPIAIVAKMTGKDFLKNKPASKTFWQKRKPVAVNLETAQKQY